MPTSESEVARTGEVMAPNSSVYVLDAAELDDIERTDFAAATHGDDDTPPSSTGQVETVPRSPRLDFLAEACDETTCFRDAVFPNPFDGQAGSRFYVRQGFPVVATSPSARASTS